MSWCFTLFLISALFISVYGSNCKTSKLSYIDSMKEYAEKYYTYESACENGGYSSIQSCKDFGYDCWYSGYHYFEASTKFLVDFPELADCMNIIEDCLTDDDGVLSKECYTCDRYVLYFYEAIVSDNNETPTESECCDSSTAEDCYEYDAWQQCANATSYCQAGWEAQCVSHRHAVWVDFVDVCSTLKHYFSSCDDASFTQYCHQLTGDESYSKLDCIRYADKLNYCPAALKISSGKLDSKIEKAEKIIHKLDSASFEEFLECLEDLNIDIPITDLDVATFSEENLLNSVSLLPLVTTLSTGLFIGLVVGVAITKKRGGYQRLSL